MRQEVGQTIYITYTCIYTHTFVYTYIYIYIHMCYYSHHISLSSSIIHLSEFKEVEYIVKILVCSEARL